MSGLSPTPSAGHLSLSLNEVEAPQGRKTVIVDGRHYEVLGDEEKISQLYKRLPSEPVSSKQFDAVLKELGVQDFSTAKAKAVGSQILLAASPSDEVLSQKVARQKAVESGLVPFVPSFEGPNTVTLKQRMDELQIHGVSIAVIKDGKLDWAQGYGELESQKGSPPPLSQAGSIGKMFTSLLILSLLEKNPGRFPDGLKTEIRPILESDPGLGKDIWTKIDPQGLTEGHPITIQHVLSHTSGIGPGASEYYNIDLLKKEISGVENSIQQLEKQRGAPGIPVDQIESIDSQLCNQQAKLRSLQEMLKDVEQDPLPALDQILRGETKLGKVEVKTLPGEKFEYSNPGFDVLQKIAQVITEKKDFTELLQKEVFDKIGMTETGHHVPLERTTSGHAYGNPLPCSWLEIPHLGAGGSLWTHAEDLVKVIPFLQKTLAGTETSIIKRDTLLEAMKGSSADKGYGLGFEVEQIENGPLYFGHSGGTPGFTARLITDTKGNGAVILTTEEARGKRITNEIIRSIANCYNWPGKEALTHCQRAAVAPPHDIEQWVNGPDGVGGTYVTKGNEHPPKDHTVYVHFSEGKVLAEVDGGEAKGNPSVLLTPLTESTASYRTELNIPLYSECEFVSKDGRKGISLFETFYPKVD